MNQQERNPLKISDLQNSQNIDAAAKHIVSASISKSLRRSPFHKLLITSQSLSLARPIALAYLDEFPKIYQPYHFQVILLDFNEEEIDHIQEILQESIFLFPKKDYFSADIQNGFKIIKLSKQLIQKRKHLYLQPGIFSITTQIFLTDLLRGYKQLSTGLKIKIIVKLSDKVQSYYDYIAWITTILKIKEKQLNQGEDKVSFIYICNKPNHYKDREELSRVYRTLFCKKIVIWPFGRSEIHKALAQFRRDSSLKQWQYTLFLSEGEKKLHQTLMQFYYFLKKSHSKKKDNFQHQSDYILYSSAIEQGFSITRGENNEFQHIKILLIHLLNSNKINLLNTVTRFIQQKDCQLWNSNNSQVIGLIQNLINQLQSSVFRYERRETHHFVDLKKILSNYKSSEFQFNSEKQSQYQCQYPLSISIVLIPQTNQKITEIISIIERIIDQKPEAVNQSQEQIPPQMKQLIKKLEQDSRLQAKNTCHNTLIMCSTESIARFIRQQLHGYILQRNYANYLRQLHRCLTSNRLFRIKKIKKIYEKKKNKSQASDQVSKKSRQKSINLQETKQIIKQILCQQIERFNQIIINYELKSSIINHQQENRQRTTQQQFDLNKQESNLLASVQKQLLQSSFLCIKPQLIKFPYSPLDVRSIYLDTNNTRKKIIVECENGSKYRTIQPSYFNQILQYYNPSTIIFYSPSPILLRSLYINQIEVAHKNLKNVHILSFQNSYETKKAAFEVTKQDESFWNISQNRSQLPQFIQSPYERIKPLNYRDSIEMGRNQLNSKSLFREQNNEGTSISSILQIQIKRKILVDTRQFKSSLPSYLYHSGFQIIPVFLKSADYVISDDAAIEKKSIHTRDLQGSIKDNRLEAQLKGMSANFRHPYLLIQCDQQSDFVKHNFAIIDGIFASKGRFQLRKRLMQLLHKFPNVRVIWSTSVVQTCELIKKLKEDRHEPDISKYLKQQSKDPQLAEVIQVSQKKQQQGSDV